MASRMKVTAEYEHRYGINQTETVQEVKMSKANAAKFAARIEARNNCEDDLYAAVSMIDETTVEFANGMTNKDYQLDDMIDADIICTIGYDFKFTK